MHIDVAEREDGGHGQQPRGKLQQTPDGAVSENANKGSVTWGERGP